MFQDFICPSCRSSLFEKDTALICKQCNLLYSRSNGFTNFIPKEDFYAGEVPQSEMKDLLNNIDTIGFDPALEEFFHKFPHLRSYVIDKKRADWVYHVIGNDYKNCLDIGSGLGNISERLSYLYDKVYSLEAVIERIEFQKRRYNNSRRSNINICRSNALKLPFEDNFFDLIVCNGVLEWIGMMNTNQEPRKAQQLFLQEMKRVPKIMEGYTSGLRIGMESNSS